MNGRFPLPDVDWEPTRPFWEAAARHELSLPRCGACGRYGWYPVGPCRDCGGEERCWTAVSGRGRLFSWSLVHRAFLPSFASWVPFVTGLVSLEEDERVRLPTLIVDCRAESLRIDMPVRAVFRALRFDGVQGSVVAPLFTPLEG